MTKALTQKNTLLQAAKANAETKACKRVFFSPAQKEFENFFSHPQKKIKSPNRTVLTRTDIALNVNRFEQIVCGLETTHLRTDSRAAHNIKIKEIKKRRALFGNQTVVLLINSVGKRTVVLLNPSFFYFFNPFFVTCNHRQRHCKQKTTEIET